MSTSLQMPSRLRAGSIATSYPRRGAGLWASGRFALRVFGPGAAAARPAEVRRPFALIGAAAGADVVLDVPGVAPRHVYLHLGRRGLFAVDLDTESGSRVGPRGEPSGWVRPGEAVELAGHRVELAAVHVDDPDPDSAYLGDPLDEASDPALPRVALYPDGGGAPLVLYSELVFAGRSAACGVQVDDPAAAPVQCALVRGAAGAFVVDLFGNLTRLNERLLRAPQALRDGDVLHIGTARFECCIRAGEPSAGAGVLPGPAPAEAAYTLESPAAAFGPPATAGGPFGVSTWAPPSDEHGHDQGMTLAWIVGSLQATHDELLRRQAAFQRDVMRGLRRLQAQQADGVSRQLERLEQLNQEVAALRDEVRRRYGAEPPRRVETPRALPSVPPLSTAVAAVAPPATAPAVDGTDAWLSRRIHQINLENRAARRGGFLRK